MLYLIHFLLPHIVRNVHIHKTGHIHSCNDRHNWVAVAASTVAYEDILAEEVAALVADVVHANKFVVDADVDAVLELARVVEIEDRQKQICWWLAVAGDVGQDPCSKKSISQ